MAELARLKTKRATARTTVTKKIKAAEKYAADDIAALRVKELQTRLQSVQGALKEHQEAHEHYMEQFIIEGKTEEEIEAETEANSVVEQNYDAVDRLSDIITMNSISLLPEEIHWS